MKKFSETDTINFDGQNYIFDNQVGKWAAPKLSSKSW